MSTGYMYPSNLLKHNRIDTYEFNHNGTATNADQRNQTGSHRHGLETRPIVTLPASTHNWRTRVEFRAYRSRHAQLRSQDWPRNKPSRGTAREISSANALLPWKRFKVICGKTVWWFWYRPATSPFNTKHTGYVGIGVSVCLVDAWEPGVNEDVTQWLDVASRRSRRRRW